MWPDAAADLPLDDPLNDYVEAHVHGGVSITRAVEEHPGFRVMAAAIDADYRGRGEVMLRRRESLVVPAKASIPWPDHGRVAP